MEVRPIAAGAPDPAEIRLLLIRGRGLLIPLDESVTMSAAMTAARTLRAALQPNVAVFASPRLPGPVLTVLQLVSDSEAAALRPALECLVAEFRLLANVLVGQMEADSSAGSDLETECPESVRCHDATWYLYQHGEHCTFEDPASGTVVEANIYSPDVLDPYFLLQYAKTSGRHGAVVDACVEGFHDMCCLLDRAGISYG